MKSCVPFTNKIIRENDWFFIHLNTWWTNGTEVRHEFAFNKVKRIFFLSLPFPLSFGLIHASTSLSFRSIVIKPKRKGKRNEERNVVCCGPFASFASFTMEWNEAWNKRNKRNTPHHIQELVCLLSVGCVLYLFFFVLFVCNEKHEQNKQNK